MAKTIGWEEYNPVIDDARVGSNTWCYAHLGLSFGFIQITTDLKSNARISFTDTLYKSGYVHSVADKKIYTQTTIDFDQSCGHSLQILLKMGTNNKKNWMLAPLPNGKKRKKKNVKNSKFMPILLKSLNLFIYFAMNQRELAIILYV